MHAFEATFSTGLFTLSDVSSTENICSWHTIPSIDFGRTISRRDHLSLLLVVALHAFLLRAVSLLRAMPGVRNPDGTWLTSERDPNHDARRFWKWQVLTAPPYDESQLGPTWCDFIPEIQRGLDEAWLTHQADFRYDCMQHHYIIDFLSAKQINSRTGTQRDVRRVWVSFPSEEPHIEQYVPPPPKPKGYGKSGKK